MRAFKAYGSANPVPFSDFEEIVTGLKAAGTDAPAGPVVEMMYAACMVTHTHTHTLAYAHIYASRSLFLYSYPTPETLVRV